MMGEISRALGQGSSLSFQGKNYTLAPWSYDLQGEFERYLEDKAWETCRRASQRLSKEEADELRAQTLRDITAGVYTFGGPVSAKALQSLPHLKRLLYLMLEKKHPEVTPQLVDEMVDQNLEQVIAAVNEVNADPFATKTAPSASA
jgi:hypothetical protein